MTGESADYSINADGQPSENYFSHQLKCHIDHKIFKEPQSIRRKGTVYFSFNNLRVRNAFLRIRQNPKP